MTHLSGLYAPPKIVEKPLFQDLVPIGLGHSPGIMTVFGFEFQDVHTRRKGSGQ